MTRIEGTQALAGGQVMWFNTNFSIGQGTAPGLGGKHGSRALGGRGNLAGSYDNTTALVVSVYGNWSF